MKQFYSEYTKNYETYSFGYSVYAILEESDQLSEAYEKGFLPYTGVTEYEPEMRDREIYYLARSLRLDTQPLPLTSELRRIQRKAEPYDIQMTWLDKKEKSDDANLRQFCADYATERYKTGSMTTARLDYLFHRQCLTHIVEFTFDDEILGYVFVGLDEISVHFWYSFYNTDWLDRFPIGKYMMLRLGQWAEEYGRQHLYLGTCYGPESLYKVRDFKGIRYFDGETWSDDITRLKSWCKSDADSMEADRMKSYN